MKLRRVAVKQFRIHREQSVTLEPGVSLITGLNGSGKTTLLEAIYVALRGHSFRGNDDAMKQHERQWYRIDLETDGVARSVIYDTRSDIAKKTFIIGQQTYRRLPAKYKYPVVLFEPDDVHIITGSPTRRREFIDTIIAQYNPQYSVMLRRYERALVQRNKLLRGLTVSPDELFPWNIILSQCGAEIVRERHQLIAEMNLSLTETYQTISATHDRVGMQYSHETMPTSDQLFKQYEIHFETDRQRGVTSIGPHRHDVVFTFNTSSADSTASRGENRTVILALKFIEAAIIEQKTELRPIILLDDVFGELDRKRQKLLVKEFEHNQIIMTSATAANGSQSVITIPDPTTH